MDNVHLWTFVDVGEDALDPESFSQWNGQKVNTVPLAFDSINYKPTVQDKFKQFDISIRSFKVVVSKPSLITQKSLKCCLRFEEV